MLFGFPLIAVVQEICARFGLYTGAGLAETIRKHYPRPVRYVCVTFLVIANTINLGADLGAMAAEAAQLLGLRFVVWLVCMTLITVALEIFVDYKRYARVLRLSDLLVVLAVSLELGTGPNGP